MICRFFNETLNWSSSEIPYDLKCNTAFRKQVL